MSNLISTGCTTNIFNDSIFDYRPLFIQPMHYIRVEPWLLLADFIPIYLSIMRPIMLTLLLDLNYFSLASVVIKFIDNVDTMNILLLVQAPFGTEDAVMLLLENGADVNFRPYSGETALFKALSGKNVAVAEILLKYGADVNVRSASNETALLMAVSYGNVAMAKTLLNSGADVNVISYGGQTPLLKAASIGDADMVELLLSYGADIQAAYGVGAAAFEFVDPKYNEGKTALMQASFFGHTQVAKILIENGAYVDATTVYGKTSLMYTTVFGYTQVAKILIENGADIDIRDSCGETFWMLGSPEFIGEIKVPALVVDNMVCDLLYNNSFRQAGELDDLSYQ